ncbi:hypothetical protein [Bacillus solitudinis]|uniref:hypothetical protein n=1 Tax=Bacillus solitudinis TaxID=2014074 RepID=UPI0012FDA340|nr:hypothetical protein [Bacillus solitudinis]
MLDFILSNLSFLFILAVIGTVIILKVKANKFNNITNKENDEIQHLKNRVEALERRE